MPAELADLSGYYGAATQQMKITLADDALTIHSLTAPAIPDQVYGYFSDGSFRDPSGLAAMIKPVVEENGETYLWQKAWGSIPGLGLAPASNYLAQKLPENPLDAETQAAWEDLFTLSAVPVNMKYTSQLYLSLFTAAAAAAAGGMPEQIPGYMGSLRIVDASNARSALAIPNQASRDSQDMTVYEEDGITCYTTNQGIVFADAAKVAQTLYTGGGAYCTVGEKGWARWCEVGEAGVGKTMTVTLPERAGFCVYDAAGNVVSSSAIYGDTSAVLPEGGSIVFVGDPGARFYLDFTPAAAPLQ